MRPHQKEHDDAPWLHITYDAFKLSSDPEMTIPNFNSVEDWQAYEKIFINRWEAKWALLERVKDDMFPGHQWKSIPAGSFQVINDIVQSMLYDTDYDFEKEYPDYKKDEDDFFVPRSSVKEMIAETIRETLKEDKE